MSPLYLGTALLLASFSISCFEVNAKEGRAGDVPSDDKPWGTLKPQGRIALDYGHIEYKDAIGAPLPGAEVSNIEVRSLRLGAKGRMGGRIDYRVDFKIKDDDIKVVNAYATYQYDDHWAVQLGQFKMMNSMDLQTSGSVLAVRERAGLVGAFDLERRVGIGIRYRGGEWSTSLAYQFETIGEAGHVEKDVFSARMTFVPTLGDDVLLHSGISFFTRNDNGSAYSGQYKLRAHDHQDSLKLARSGDFSILSETFLAAEFAVRRGPLSFQSEGAVLFNEIADTETAIFSDPKYYAYYGEVSYFLTGEARAYDRKEGRFHKTPVRNSIPDGGLGAVQLAFRYDRVNLEHQEGGNFYGNNQASYIFGVNWFLTNQARLKVNFSHSDMTQGRLKLNSVSSLGVRLELDW